MKNLRLLAIGTAVLAGFWIQAAAAENGATQTPAGVPAVPYTYRAALFFDWLGIAYEQGGGFLNQLGTRIKFEIATAPARSWTLLLDVRDRMNMTERSSNQILLYNARLTYDSPSNPITVSAGQMNLYDTAGIGQLLGSVAGFKLKTTLLLGGYAGLDQQVYARKLDTRSLKYGLFVRYTGPRALSLSLSYNRILYSGRTERAFLYAQGLLPVRKVLYVYGNVEYELGSDVKREDRLSRVFLNVRLDLSQNADVSGFYSSGRGLDFHSYVLERSQDPNLADRGLERFFYSELYGGRLAVKPLPGVRISVSRQESRQKDMNIQNHTWRFGASAADILKSGVTAYADYSWNRGTNSESDSYNLSLNRDLGRFSCSVSFANTFNGLRFSSADGAPQIIHLDGYKTISGYVFAPLTKRLSVAVEYRYFLQRKANEHQFFLRLMWRK